MKNQELWKPSKYTYDNGKLVATSDSQELGIASRLMASLIARKYQKAIPKFCYGKLLDLGCGKAPFYEAYKNYVTDIDLADWANGLHQNDCIDYFIDLTMPLPFISSSYDTVILSDVLEHIPNPDKLLAEIYRLLSNGGVLLVNVPFYYWIHEAPYDYFRFSKYYLKNTSESCGFAVEQIDTLGGTNEVMADIISKSILLAKVPFIGNVLVKLIQQAAIFFSSTALGHGYAEKSSKYFPFGYFIVLRKK